MRLRPFTTDDAGWVYEVSQDPRLRHYVRLPSPYLFEHAEYFVREVAIAGWDSGRRAEFLAEDSATGARLGRVGLDLRERRDAEVGFWVGPDARNGGVATAMVRAVCGWAFETLAVQLVEWRCEVGNVASRRVAEKAGFTAEATLRKRLVHRGERVDAWVGSLLSPGSGSYPGPRRRPPRPANR